MRHQQRIRSM